MRPLDITLAVLILAGLAAVTGLLGRNEELAGPATVIDGDTLDIAGIHVRLAGIDAPELKQQCVRRNRPWPCGEAARRALEEAIGGARVSCASSERDVYGRPVARCRAGTLDLADHMVREGYALAYRGRDYAGAEAEARAGRRGVWSGTFEPPAEWRAAHPRRS
ncbi:thermonuclease family protein [Xanthobacter sp. V3C-3]|uniref:thermonuclease family protein n=1 Tax=Xanthobacter lutulentifluminis TaxID=3119935 RepID=UPI0037288A3B